MSKLSKKYNDNTNNENYFRDIKTIEGRKKLFD